MIEKFCNAEDESDADSKGASPRGRSLRSGGDNDKKSKIQKKIEKDAANTRYYLLESLTEPEHSPQRESKVAWTERCLEDMRDKLNREFDLQLGDPARFEATARHERAKEAKKAAKKAAKEAASKRNRESDGMSNCSGESGSPSAKKACSPPSTSGSTSNSPSVSVAVNISSPERVGQVTVNVTINNK